jgi:hypothetical protein
MRIRELLGGTFTRLFGRSGHEGSGGLGGEGDPDGGGGGAQSAVTDGASPIAERVHAEREDDFVVFLVGMRINSFRKVRSWFPVFRAAPRMLREQREEIDGLLGSRTTLGPGIRNLQIVQYWESFDALEAYARDSDFTHLDAWQQYNRSGGPSDTAVGIWHETYLVDADAYETVYNGVPPFGLGAAEGTELVPTKGGLDSAAGRLNRSDE